MKNEHEMIRGLFDACLPDNEQITRMEQKICCAHEEQKKTGSLGKLRLLPILAAALVMTVGISAIASAPAIKRYFFPGVGVVEVDGAVDVPPLYMLADQDCDVGADFSCLYGYWYDNTAEVWITSQTRYEEIQADILFGDTDGAVELMYVSNMDGDVTKLQSTYRIIYSDVPWEDAAQGLPLGEYSVPFTRMAAEYRTYSIEDKGLRLELIPLTDDLTTFAAGISYLDGRGDIYLNQRSHYLYQNPYDAMALVDAAGNTYPLKKMEDINIFSVRETPHAEIVGFRADYLTFVRDFSAEGESVTVALPLPADGEAMDVGVEFVFPDGVTRGRVRSVGYNTTLTEDLQIDRTQDFGGGYYAVVTDAVEQNGVQYWTELFYTDAYYAYLEEYLVEEIRSPYDRDDDNNPMRPMHMISLMGLENAVQHVEHYIPDGKDTVTMKANHYSAIAYGNWDIDFTDMEIGDAG